jgi:hypothetical protein
MYNGEVMCFKDDNYTVNFIRSSSTLGDKFIKPETENTASVHEKLIK